jgi:oxygen-independent coproporphyrinogen-3 oxidase
MTLAHLRAPSAAYVHVPFCAHRCGYCDFTLVARREDLIEEDYLRALEQELAALESPRTVATIFVGGGTPTHLSANQLHRLLVLIDRWFRLDAGYEFTVEANPAGLSDDKLALLAQRRQPDQPRRAVVRRSHPQNPRARP